MDHRAWSIKYLSLSPLNTLVAWRALKAPSKISLFLSAKHPCGQAGSVILTSPPCCLSACETRDVNQSPSASRSELPANMEESHDGSDVCLVPNAEEWLALRVIGGARTWRFPSCFGADAGQRWSCAHEQLSAWPVLSCHDCLAVGPTRVSSHPCHAAWAVYGSQPDVGKVQTPVATTRVWLSCVQPARSGLSTDPCCHHEGVVELCTVSQTQTLVASTRVCLSCV